MRRSRVIIAAVLGVAGATAAVYVARQRRGAVETYRFVQVTRGDIESTVSATGALSAVRTVQVGTQVSGQIAEIRVDFNDRVRRGQLIARLDTTLLAQAVREAEATLERSRADADRRAFELRQASELWAQRFITETEYRTAQFNATSALTTQRSAEAALDRARQNLAYAYIHAPVNGVVIERNVDVGQTVAASFSAPQLFLIAEDLGRMQILASVAESDIGQITEGQVARFTVQAWPNVTFAGKVKQVRMQSKTQENVVNYSVAVEVDNRDGKLLPGMTATVSFLVDAVRGVLRVPNAALRFKPTAQLLARATRDTVVPADTAVGRAVPAVRGSRDSALRGRAASTAGARALRTGELWLVSPEGRASSRVVRLGLTDGQFTEVTGAGIVEGMQVIAAVIGGETAERATTGTNPFEGNQRPGGRPGPPPGM